MAPKEEDSVSFNVFGANGEVFQLKADTAKDRQRWVDAIRTAVQILNEATIDPLAVKMADTQPNSKGLNNKKYVLNQLDCQQRRRLLIFSSELLLGGLYSPKQHLLVCMPSVLPIYTNWS